MVTDCKKWPYLGGKNLSSLLRGITSNHVGDSFCLNCFHSYRTENKLYKHEKVFNDHDYYYLEMPNEDNKILKCNYGEKSLKAPFIIYADFAGKMHSCQNNPEKSYAEKKTKHTTSGYLIFTSCSFDATKKN